MFVALIYTPNIALVVIESCAGYALLQVAMVFYVKYYLMAK